LKITSPWPGEKGFVPATPAPQPPPPPPLKRDDVNVNEISLQHSIRPTSPQGSPPCSRAPHGSQLKKGNEIPTQRHSTAPRSGTTVICTKNIDLKMLQFALRVKARWNQANLKTKSCRT